MPTFYNLNKSQLMIYFIITSADCPKEMTSRDDRKLNYRAITVSVSLYFNVILTP